MSTCSCSRRALRALSFRRGWTHGIARAAAVADAADRRSLVPSPRSIAPAPRMSIRRFTQDGCSSLCYVGVYSHVFLDYLNNYGVRLRRPSAGGGSTETRSSSSIRGCGWCWGRASGSPAVSGGPLPARAALLCAAVLHPRDAGVGARRAGYRRWTSGATREASSPVRSWSVPRRCTPFTREVIVDVGDHYERGTFSWWPAGVRSIPCGCQRTTDAPEIAAARQRSQRARLSRLVAVSVLDGERERAAPGDRRGHAICRRKPIRGLDDGRRK